MAVGRIYRRTGGLAEAPAWVWTILNVHAGPGIMMSNGVVNTLDEAKAELAKNWRKWLVWVGFTTTRPEKEVAKSLALSVRHGSPNETLLP